MLRQKVAQKEKEKIGFEEGMKNLKEAEEKVNREKIGRELIFNKKEEEMKE